MSWEPGVWMQYIFRKPFGIHSPFLYNFAVGCIFADAKDQLFAPIEQNRAALKAQGINVPDPKTCRLLYRTAAYFQVNEILEAETRQNITREYFKLSRQDVNLSLTDIDTLADYADNRFNGLIFIDAAADTAKLAKSFPLWSGKLHHNSVVIMAGIRNGRLKKSHWRNLSANMHVTLALDLGNLGYLFFNQALSKQNIRVGF